MAAGRRLSRVARRRLGQHFSSPRVARDIASRVCKLGPRVALEVGIGSGAVASRVDACTQLLVGVDVDYSVLSEARVLALEPNVEVVAADALRPPVELSRVDVVYGSIPYSITGPLLALLAREFQGPAVLVMQREVARRLAARPGSSEYGRITVLVQFIYDVELGPTYSPREFTPPPKVYSQLVELRPWRRLPSSTIEALERLTACMFSERRRRASKVARKCLGLDVNLGERRVYELSVDDFESLLLEASDAGRLHL